jgi:hypothetical protein
MARDCCPSSVPQAAGPRLVSCPRLLNQYIHSYLEAVSSIRYLRFRHAMLTSDSLSLYPLFVEVTPWVYKFVDNIKMEGP